jgi:phosphomannomutase
MLTELDRITKAYDIRGIADVSFTSHHAFALGRGFADWASSTGRVGEGGGIVVGRDCRNSGEGFAAAFMEGVLCEGIDVYDIGLCSTDMAYAASGVFAAPVAMLTASHNPAEYNGVKLAGPSAEPLSRSSGLTEVITAAARRATLPASGVRGVVRSVDFLSTFVDLVLERVDTAPLRGLDVVVDVANGMGGLIVPAVADAVGLRARVLYGELDGSFPNHPADPLNPANLVDLQAAVRERPVFAGIAFDGDADRAFLVDDGGVPVSGSTTTALVAVGMLAAHPGSTILHNLICSRSVPETIAANGGIAIRTPVGHSLIKQYMADTGAVFGGEHSAHYYFRSFWRADSGILAALHALTLVVEAGQPLSVHRQRFERYVSSGEVNVSVVNPAVTLDAAAAAFEHRLVDRLDGVSVSGDRWWGNLRGSNTEPVLRVNLEARDDKDLAAAIEEVDEFLAPHRTPASSPS